MLPDKNIYCPATTTGLLEGASSVRKLNYAIGNEALGTFASIGVFSKDDLSPTLIQSFGTMYN